MPNGSNRLFRTIIFALLLVWFALHSITFFLSTPIPVLELIPDLLLLGVLILAAFSAGSYALELMRLDEVSPMEDFIFATTCGLGMISLMTILVALAGFLNWWTMAIGLTLLIAGGFRRIVGLVTPPAYLFGPDEGGDDNPSLVAWIQYFLLALWIAVLFHFVLMPPVISESLAAPLGEVHQWVLSGRINPDAYVLPQTVSLTTGLYALAMAVRGPHLVMMLSGLVAGLTLITLYSLTKRYSGPTAGRSTVLIASSVPIFSYLLLNPGDGMLLALFQIVSFFSMMRWFDEKKRRWALASGLFVGYSLSASITTVFFLVPMLVIALVWAFSQQNFRRFILHLVIAGGAVVIWLLPWAGMHLYVFYDAIHLVNPLLSVDVMQWQQALASTLSLPIELSFPSGELPLWRVVGPIFLIFVPFYFLIKRKNPMSSMATAIGLVTVLIGRPFGVILDYRLVSVLLLSVPTAMATHRLSDEPVKRGITMAMLLLLVFWYFYHATSVVEEQFDSPHRYLLGIETEAEYLSHAVDYYDDARKINEITGGSGRVISLGHPYRLYFDIPIVVARPGITEELLEIFAESPGIDQLIHVLREDGFTHIMLSMKPAGKIELLDELRAALKPKQLFAGSSVALYSLE